MLEARDAEEQHDQDQDETVDDPGKTGHPPGTHIDHRADDGTCAGHAAEDAGDEIANTLTEQFPVAVVP